MKSYNRIVVFDKLSCERESWSALLAIGQGFKNRNIKFMYFNPAYFKPSKGEIAFFEQSIGDQKKTYPPDLIFTWGTGYPEVAEFHKREYPNCDIVKVGRGFLNREQEYWYAVKNNELPKGKPLDRFNTLRIQKMPGKPPTSKYILICEQNHDLGWYMEQKRIIHQSKRSDQIVKERSYNSKEPLEKDLHGAECVVSYNSTCLYAAMAQGIPVFCSRDCLAAEVAQTDMTQIGKPIENPDYSKFLANLAYAQWSLEEYKQGMFIDHLLSY